MEIKLENLNLIESIAKDLEFIKNELKTPSQKRWLGVKELAEYLNYSKDRIYKLKDETLKEGVHFYKKGGKILFDRVAIDEWVIQGDNDEHSRTQRQVVDRLLSSIQKG